MTYDLNITFDDNLVTGNNTILTGYYEISDTVDQFFVLCINGIISGY